MHDVGAAEVGLSDQLLALGVPCDNVDCVSSGYFHLEARKVGEDICWRDGELLFEDIGYQLFEFIFMSVEEDFVCVVEGEFFVECLGDTRLQCEDLSVSAGYVLVGSLQLVRNTFRGKEVFDRMAR